MKYRIHRSLSELIREGCEGRLNIQINPRWFAMGNVYPDCTHQRVLHLHEWESAGRMLLSRWRSLRLGIISHYICDFSCYAHTASFAGTLRQHRSYEAVQGRLHPAPAQKSDCDFHAAASSSELIDMLDTMLRQREKASFSPAEDLHYAAAAGTQLACAMLRLCLNRPTKPAVWRRLPLLRRRLARAG